jgi:hypothetical protein
MPALNSTTLSAPLLPTDRRVRLASISGVRKDDLLYIGRELMTVLDASVNPLSVARGANGTNAVSHVNGQTVYSGTANQFHNYDPSGVPLKVPIADPWINVRDGRVWVAQGDTVGPGAVARRWQLQQSTYAAGALGILTPPTVTP